MDFPELVYGRLIKRYKRFLADIELDNGEIVTAHCANPGSMRSLLEPSPRCWLSRARPGRKLAYTWEVAEQGETRIYVNPMGANRVVADALTQNVIKELIGYDVIQPEVKYGENSRIDFLLTGRPGRAYVEVKSMTMTFGDGRCAFPDSVTKRGTKHLLELERMVSQGTRAVLLFCVGRTDAKTAEAAGSIDPTYASTLRQVAKSGVEVLAYTGPITHAGFKLDRRVDLLGIGDV